MQTEAKKRAYISVFDKKGIEIAAKKLTELNYEIISTGNTFEYLKDAPRLKLPSSKAAMR